MTFIHSVFKPCIEYTPFLHFMYFLSVDLSIAMTMWTFLTDGAL